MSREDQKHENGQAFREGVNERLNEDGLTKSGSDFFRFDWHRKDSHGRSKHAGYEYARGHESEAKRRYGSPSGRSAASAPMAAVRAGGGGQLAHGVGESGGELIAALLGPLEGFNLKFAFVAMFFWIIAPTFLLVSRDQKRGMWSWMGAPLAFFGANFPLAVLLYCLQVATPPEIRIQLIQSGWAMPLLIAWCVLEVLVAAWVYFRVKRWLDMESGR